MPALFDPADISRQGPQRSTPAGLRGSAGAFGRRAAYGRAFDAELEKLRCATRAERHDVLHTTSVKAGSLIEGGCLDLDDTVARIEGAAIESGIEKIIRIRRQIKRGIEWGRKTPRGPDLTENRRTYDRPRLPPGSFAASVLTSAQDRGVEFKGMAGNTALAVAAAMASIAEGCGKHDEPFAASMRQISEVARIGSVGQSYDPTPIRRAQAYLTDKGIVERVARGRGRMATVWRICTPQVTPHTKEQNSPKEEVVVVGGYGESLAAVSHHVVWDRLGLGVSCQLVHRVLTTEWTTVRVIVEQTGKADDTIRRSLKRMATHGMAEVDESGRYPRWRAIERSLDEVSAELDLTRRDHLRHLAHLEQRMMDQDRYDRYIAASLRGVDPVTGEIRTG